MTVAVHQSIPVVWERATVIVILTALGILSVDRTTVLSSQEVSGNPRMIAVQVILQKNGTISIQSLNILFRSCRLASDVFKWPSTECTCVVERTRTPYRYGHVAVSLLYL